jgi:UDP-N-acetylmuramoyl-L-alanyl-D-glutamate--2,6-diaminopimelate ligase
MAKRGCEYVFMEVSSHAMDQNRVAGIHFTGGIFTNLTQDHLDYHKTMKKYFLAKKKFFQMLPAKAFALTNFDDDHGRHMIEGIQAYPFFYGFKGPALNDTHSVVGEVQFKGDIVGMDFSGLRLKFNDIKVETKLLGTFNAYNTLAVWSACSLLGFDMEKVNKILEDITPPKGRFDYFTSDPGVLVVIDYAHTPDALEKIISAVKEVKPKNGKLITVFGCGGDRDSTKRKIMGKIGAENSDIAIFTSDNPRSEDEDKIIEEMKIGLSTKEFEKVKSISNRREAITESVKLAQKGDIILCAGKGHETYQEIKGVKNHFDDMEEYKKLFK